MRKQPYTNPNPNPNPPPKGTVWVIGGGLALAGGVGWWLRNMGATLLGLKAGGLMAAASGVAAFRSTPLRWLGWPLLIGSLGRSNFIIFYGIP